MGAEITGVVMAINVVGGAYILERTNRIGGHVCEPPNVDLTPFSYGDIWRCSVCLKDWMLREEHEDFTPYWDDGYAVD